MELKGIKFSKETIDHIKSMTPRQVIDYACSGIRPAFKEEFAFVLYVGTSGMDGKRFWDELPSMMDKFKLQACADDTFEYSTPKFGYEEGYVQLFYASEKEIKDWAYESGISEMVDQMAEIERKRKESKSNDELYRKIFYPLYECMDGFETKAQQETKNIIEVEQLKVEYMEDKLKELYPGVESLFSVAANCKEMFYMGIKLKEPVSSFVSIGKVSIYNGNF